MIRARRSGLSLALVLIGAISNPDTIEAQGLFGLDRGGSLGFRYSVDRSGRPGDTPTEFTLFEQWVRLPFRGTLIDQRIATYNFSFNPQWSQNRIEPSAGSKSKNQLMGLTGSFAALQSHRLSFSFSGTRSRGRSENSFGRARERENSTYRGTIRLRSSFLRGSFNFSHRVRNDLLDLGSGGLPLEWGNVRDQWTLAVQNSKLTASLRREEYGNLYTPVQNGFLTGRVRHFLRWGRGSNLTSTYNYRSRINGHSQVSRSWGERASLIHTEAIRSNYHFTQNTAETNGKGVTTRRYGLGIRYRPASASRFNLNGGTTLSRWSTAINGSSQSRVSASSRLGLAIPMPFSTRISLGGAVGWENTERNNWGIRTIPVISERHQVDQTLTFLLDNPRADENSVRVRNAEESVEFTLGIDYELTIIGVMTEVTVQPGGRILEGQTVAVSYEFETEGLPSGNLTTASYNAAWGLRWVSMYHHRSVRQTEAGNGESGFSFGTFDEQRTGANLNAVIPFLGIFNAGVDRTERRSSAFDFRVDGLRATLSRNLGQTFQLSLGANVRESSSKASQDKLRSSSVSARVRWRLGRLLRVSSALRWFRSGRNSHGSQSSLGGNVNVDFRFAGIAAQASYGYWKAVQPSVTITERFSFALMRNF